MSEGSYTDTESVIFEDEQINSQESNPLYPKAEVDAAEFQTLLMSLIQKHNLTYSCQDDLLKIFSAILPSPAVIPSSCYVLRHRYVNLQEDCSIFYFCSCCFGPLHHFVNLRVALPVHSSHAHNI